jgi:hypothetical protein
MTELIEHASVKAQLHVEEVVQAALASAPVAAVRERLEQATKRNVDMRSELSAAEAKIIALRAESQASLAAGYPIDTAGYAREIALLSEQVSLLRPGIEKHYPSLAIIQGELELVEREAITAACLDRLAPFQPKIEKAADRLAKIKTQHALERAAAEKELAESLASRLELAAQAGHFMQLPDFDLDSPDVLAMALQLLVTRGLWKCLDQPFQHRSFSTLVEQFLA